MRTLYIKSADFSTQNTYRGRGQNGHIFAYVLNGWSTKACGVWRSVIFSYKNQIVWWLPTKEIFQLRKKRKIVLSNKNGFALKKAYSPGPVFTGLVGQENGGWGSNARKVSIQVILTMFSP